MLFRSNNANLIARYPEALADKPQRIDLTDSLPCYQDAFAKIQRVVNDLDKRSREGVAALRAASELQRSSDSRSTKLASGPDTINRDVRSTSSAQRIPAFVKKENRQSDITGTDQKLPVSEGIFKH